MTVKRMFCKLKNPDGSDCGMPIDFDTETRKAIVVSTGQPHIHEKPKTWTKKEFKPLESDLRIDAINSEIKAMKEDILKLFDIVKAHTQELSFKKASGGNL